MRPAVPALAAALLAVGAMPALAAAPVSATPARSATHRPVLPGPAGRPSWFARHGGHPAGVSGTQRRAAAALRPSAPAKLDPSVAAATPAPNGTVRATVVGKRAAVAARVAKAGGRVLAATDGSSSVVVPKAQLRELASAPDVTTVQATERPYATGNPAPGPSQAVAASNADQWQTATPPISGAGVKLAIIDIGFGDDQAQYNAEVSAGNLGASPTVVNEDCTDFNNASTPYDGTAHGLAVAEIAHQQAPDTQLFLYCIGSKQGAANAELAVEAAGITLISSSLGWYNDARGDGTTPTGSLAAISKRARQHGILWVNSAGNEVPQHWSGSLSDLDHDGYLDIGNHSETTYPFESDFFYTAPGTTASPSVLSFFFSWDGWPTTANQVSLQAYGVQCRAQFGSGGVDDCNGYDIPGSPLHHLSTKNGTPTTFLDTHTLANTSPYPQVWDVVAQFAGAFTPGLHYDLYAAGDAYFASDLACPAEDSNHNCIFAAPAVRDSVLSPANSPYVLATGAADVGADGIAAGTLEPFSSQGPTIDGRVKPEITGWDGLSSYVADYNTGFYGTSAAAPTVAGAAALVADANPGMDAAQIQDFLQRRANSGSPYNPPNNAFGHGLLTLGAPSGVAPPAAAQYQAITPRRILDTRTTTGGHHAPLGAGGTVTVTVPGLPDDATAVAINLTGVGATAGTFLSAYPGGTTFPGTSNLNLSTTDRTAAVMAIVTVRNKAITIRNAGGSVNVLVDELGYFGTGAESGKYTPLTPARRVLDTRGNTGGHHGKVAPGAGVTVRPALPADATAAVVNITSTDTLGSGYLSAAPGCSASASTVNFGRYTRANLAVVKLSPTGTFCVFDGGNAADVIVDVVGVIGSSGAGYVALPSAQRIVDTRTGNGGSAGQHPSRALGPATSTLFYGSNVGIVPSSATALLTGVVEANATASGYLTLFAGTTRPSSLTSNLNFSTRRVVPNAVIIGVSARIFGIYNAAGNTNAAVDLFGYFIPLGG